MPADRGIALRWVAPALLFAAGTACLHPHPAHALAFDSSNLWPRGTELKVCFYNGGARERDFVARAAGEWGKYGNLKFDLGKIPGGETCSTAAYFPVRIVFTDNATWTFPGPKAAQEIPRDKPTMSLGILGQPSTTDEMIARRTVLHEFGHLLGFLHEEQNPRSDCLGKLDWASIGRTFNTTRERLFGPPIEPSRLSSTEADNASIMMFSIPNKYLLQASDPGNCPTAVANELSPIDKRGMALAYPAGQSSNTAFVAAAVQPAPRTPLRVMLEERIGFGSMLTAVVGEMTSALPAGYLPDGLQDVDREAATTLLALSTLAAKRVVDNPANSALPFVADYLAGRYNESYDAARESASKKDASADAALLLAQMNLRGLGRPHDIDTAVTWIRAAAQAKAADGALMLGFAYLYGVGVSKDGAVAVEHLKIAERADQPIAAHMLGALYFSGQVVQQNYRTAYAYFSSGASRGFVPSQRALAVMSDQGLGTDRDAQKALGLAKTAAGAEDSTALLLLGLIYADGTGTSSNTVQALGLFQKAAGGDAPLPNAVLGVVYETGQLGVQRDRVKAIEHYSKAEGLASGKIALRLAELYLQGGAAGELMAVPMLRKAAEAGQIGAQLKLGEFYRTGFGVPTGEPAPAASAADVDPYPVPQNPARAFGWFTLASLYASGPERQAALAQAQEIGRNINRADWVAGTEFAVARIRKRDGLLQQAAESVPSGAAAKEPSVPQSTGSGVVVGKAGQILTNAHVVKGCTYVRVTLDGRKSKAKILHPGNEAGVDLALLQTEYYPGIAAKFRSAPLRAETIVVMGFPVPDVLGEDSHLVTQPGPITALTGANDDTNRFQVSATINPGNSGGPLFDLNGNIAGIAVARVNSEILQNTYFAIKSSIATNFLESYHVPPEIGGTEEKLGYDKLEEQRRAYVAFVECFAVPGHMATKP